MRKSSFYITIMIFHSPARFMTSTGGISHKKCNEKYKYQYFYRFFHNGSFNCTSKNLIVIAPACGRQESRMCGTALSDSYNNQITNSSKRLSRH